MKKSVLFILLVLLFASLPAAALDKELAGTWIGFGGENELLREEYDFTILQFTPDNNELKLIETDGDKYTEYTGTLQEAEGKLLFVRSDSEQDEMEYRFENGKLLLTWDWRDERAYVRIDDSYYPEDPENSPFFGADRTYLLAMTPEGGIRIWDYRGTEETIEIPETLFGLPVTEIDKFAISFKEEMKHLILPDGIRKIDTEAFEENRQLLDVRLPDTLESLGDRAFMYCGNLREIIIPEGIKLIDDSTFWQCNSLERIVLPESVEEIHPDAFYGADRAVFTVKQGSYAEQFCKENEYKYNVLDGEQWAEQSPESDVPAASSANEVDPDLIGAWITFLDGEVIIFRFTAEENKMTILDNDGFDFYTNTGTWKTEGSTIIFTQEEFGDTYDQEIPYSFTGGKLYLDYYGENAYNRMDESLIPEDPQTSPYLGENKEYWYSQLEDGTIQIDGYDGTAETLAIPGNIFGFPVTSIRETAFMSLDNLKHVIVPDGVTFIGRQAFSYNSALESIVLPDSLRTLEYSAFEFDESLKEIVIPEGVTFLDTDTFGDCDNLTRVTLPKSLEAIDEAFDYQTRESILFTVQPGSYAEQYCKENGLKFVHPGEEAPAPEPQTGSDEQQDLTEAEPDESPNEEGAEALYNEAMFLYEEEKYYSARQAFLMSEFGNWEEMAEKCIRDWPQPGEIWRDRSQWLQDMELTIVIDQPEDTAMFVRIFKDKAPVSYLFISGPESVTVRLPGNGYYEIKDGIGTTWYGIKEAFGPEGSYESMTFDEQGTETVYLKSYYAYTLSINIGSSEATGDDVYSESEGWDDFIG